MHLNLLWKFKFNSKFFEVHVAALLLKHAYTICFQHQKVCTLHFSQLNPQVCNSHRMLTVCQHETTGLATQPILYSTATLSTNKHDKHITTGQFNSQGLLMQWSIFTLFLFLFIRPTPRHSDPAYKPITQPQVNTSRLQAQNQDTGLFDKSTSLCKCTSSNSILQNELTCRM